MSPEEQERQAIIQRAKDILSEHFDCGEILVQAQDEKDSDNTNRYESGWAIVSPGTCTSTSCTKKECWNILG